MAPAFSCPFLGIWDSTLTNTHESINPINPSGTVFWLLYSRGFRSSKAKSNPSSDPLQLKGASHRLFLIGCGVTASLQQKDVVM